MTVFSFSNLIVYIHVFKFLLHALPNLGPLRGSSMPHSDRVFMFVDEYVHWVTHSRSVSDSQTVVTYSLGSVLHLDQPLHAAYWLEIRHCPPQSSSHTCRHLCIELSDLLHFQKRLHSTPRWGQDPWLMQRP